MVSTKGKEDLVTDEPKVSIIPKNNIGKNPQSLF